MRIPFRLHNTKKITVVSTTGWLIEALKTRFVVTISVVTTMRIVTTTITTVAVVSEIVTTTILFVGAILINVLFRQQSHIH